MKIRLLEPANHKYIWINPQTNTVHLLVPLVAGKDIALDNSCQQYTEYNAFKINNAALLAEYKQKLLIDLEFLAEDEEKRLKKDRLEQIEHYIKTFYPAADFNKFVNTTSNLQAVKVTASSGGYFSSASYTKLYSMTIPAINPLISGTPRERLTKKALESFAKRRLPANCQVVIDEIIKELNATHKQMFGDHYNIDFSLTNEEIGFLGYDNVNVNTVDSKLELNALIKAMIGKANEETDYPPVSVFRSTNTGTLADATSFLLAEINVYCRVRDLSFSNFGTVLASDSYLVNQLEKKIKTTIEQDGVNGVVESMICNFVNEHAKAFGLTKQLTGDQIKAISQRFDGHYRTTLNAQHRNEFLILDTDVKNKTTFLNHQNSICLDASYVTEAVGLRAKDEVKNLPVELPIKNDDSVGMVDVNINYMKAYILAAIHDKNSLKLQTLLSMTEKNTPLFEELGRDFFKQFDDNQQTQALFITLMAKIHDANISQKFGQIVRNTVKVTLTNDKTFESLRLAFAIKHNTTLDSARQYQLRDAVYILSQLDVKNHKQVQLDDKKIVFEMPENEKKNLDKLVDEYIDESYLSPAMVDGLYQEVKFVYGKDSKEFKDMERLPIKSNSKQLSAPKLSKALELLKINIKPETIKHNTNLPLNGYLIKNLDKKILQQINDINTKRERQFIFDRSMAEQLYARITNKADIAKLNKFANTDKPNKTEVALYLLGVTNMEIQYHAKDEFVVTFNNQAQGITAWKAYLANLVNPLVSTGSISKYSIKTTDLNKKINELPVKRPSVKPDTDKAKIQNMLNELIYNIKYKKNNRQTWFDKNTDPKVNKLEAILSWVSDKDKELSEQEKNILLGLIHNVCAIKRNTYGWFNPHSLAEFQTLAQSLKIDVTHMSQSKMTNKTLDMLETNATAVYELIAQQKQAGMIPAK